MSLSYATRSNNLFNKNFLIVPPEAAYAPEPHSDDFILSHRLKKIWPETNAVLGENASMRFHIYGAGQHLDTKSLRLFFKAKALYPSGNEATDSLSTFEYYEPTRFTDWIGSIFRTVEIRLNNQTLISRIDYRNILHNMISLFTVPDTWKSSVAGQNEFYCKKLMYRTPAGFVRFAPSSTLMELSKKEQSYCIEFDLENIMQSQKYIPMDLVRSIDIELITDSFRRVITKDWGTFNASTFTIDNSITQANGYTDLGRALKNNLTYAPDQPFDSMAHNILYLDAEQLEEQKATITADEIEWNAKLSWSFDATTGETKQYATRDAYQAAKDNHQQSELYRTYQVRDYYMTADFYTFNDAYRASLEQALLTSGITIPMDSWLTVTENINRNSTHEIRIRRSLTSLKTLLISFESPKATSECQITIDGKTQYVSDGLSHFDLYGLKSYQVVLNGVPIQGHKISTDYSKYSRQRGDDNAEHIYETLKAFSIHGDTVITGAQGDGLSKGGAESSSVYDANTVVEAPYFQNFLEYTEGKALSPANALHSYDQIPDYRHMKQNNIIAVNFEKSSQVSGESMEELVILLEFDQTKMPTDGMLAHCFLHYDQHLEIRGGYDFTIHE